MLALCAESLENRQARSRAATIKLTHYPVAGAIDSRSRSVLKCTRGYWSSRTQPLILRIVERFGFFDSLVLSKIDMAHTVRRLCWLVSLRVPDAPITV
jgi:hypothetical protein